MTVLARGLLTYMARETRTSLRSIARGYRPMVLPAVVFLHRVKLMQWTDAPVCEAACVTEASGDDQVTTWATDAGMLLITTQVR
jgi:hypothetical protein